MRIADETWERLKEERRKSGKSWNLFSLMVLKLLKRYGHKKFDGNTSITMGHPSQPRKVEK